MIPESSEIIFVRHQRKSRRQQMRVVMAAVLVGLMTAAALAWVMIVEAGKRGN
jgi:hypothetical protein